MRTVEQIQADITAAVARGDNAGAEAFLPEWQEANHAAEAAKMEAIGAAMRKYRHDAQRWQPKHKSRRCG